MGLWLLSSRRYHPLSLLGSTQTQTRSVTSLPESSLSPASATPHSGLCLKLSLYSRLELFYPQPVSLCRQEILPPCFHVCFLPSEMRLISSQFLGCDYVTRTLEFYVQFSVTVQLRVFARGSVPSSRWFIVVKMPKTCLKQFFSRKVSCDQTLEITWRLEEE